MLTKINELYVNECMCMVSFMKDVTFEIVYNEEFSFEIRNVQLYFPSYM